MYEFKEGDTVTFVFNKKDCYGTIDKINTKTADVWIYDIDEPRTLSLSRLTPAWLFLFAAPAVSGRSPTG